jgi:hypothetical protein
MEDMTVRINKLKAVWMCTAAAVLIMRGVPVIHADEPDYKAMYDEQKKRSDDLEKRVSALEGASTQNLAVAKSDIPQRSLDFLGQVELSGYVSGAYIYDFSRGTRAGVPSTIAGRLYDSGNNEFTPNKFKLTLEKPIDFNPTNWNAGFRADLIAGKDAQVIHSTGLFSGESIDLEQAYVNFNIPVGNGLKVLFGKHVTMMGVEVVEEVANPNLSIGNQFMYVENTTETGVLVAYKWSDKFETDLCMINGWDQVTDVNASKTWMGRIVFTPDADTTLAFLGDGGCEEPADNRDWRTGADIVLNRNKLFTDKLNAWVQLDYGHEDNAPLADGSGTTTANADWYAAGLWLTYDFTDKVELAFRTDYLSDKDGVRTPSSGTVPVTGPVTFTEAPKELISETLTLNLKPVSNLQVRPEIRYDHSSASQAFNGKQDQVTGSIGLAYLF